ncbi:acyltransferase family protein [Chryseobacterium foetidum]|uniref:acyltransferase family protein n=1 Tax=Chryseobacterium foetidum TaxID=2951057 RepID=UPI0021CAC42A|nr:acyltransferase [Chryseobacterium foetidum]
MRSLAIDLLKIILALFVVGLHIYFLRDSYPTLSYLLVNGLFRLGVPVFLIITGYYFSFVNDFSKLKKWLFRIFILYAIWTVIYIPLWKEGDAVSNIVFGYHHLWYLNGTLFAGIFLFFLRHRSPKLLISLVFLFFLCGYTIQYLGNSHFFEGETNQLFNRYPMYRNFLFDCFPFLTIGFLIKKYEWDVKRNPSLWLVLVSVSAVVAEAFVNIQILKLPKKESVDLLFSLLIACPLVFIYFKNLKFKTDSKILASISTAIYFIHPMLMYYVYKSENLLILQYDDFIFISSLILSGLVLVILNQKLKYLL